MALIKKIDFTKETFEVGKSYSLQDIKKMHEINKSVSTITFYGIQNKPRKETIHLNLYLEDIDLWFIRDSYSSYKCVMFEN